MSLTTTSPTGHHGEPLTAEAATARAALPSWPITALFGAYALWWLLGVLDVIIIPLAAVMVVYLVRSGGVRVPRFFGVWMFFLLWAAASFVMVHGAGPIIGFTYRYLIYASSTVLFVYVYNARQQLRARRVFGLLTSLWVVTVIGGYLGVFDPSGLVKTPMAYVVGAVKVVVPASATLLNNELITHMVVRRFSQFNAGSFFALSPRPAAPFRFTNNWGNVYSVLLPIVVAYALQLRGRRRVLMWIALPLSAVPAFLTLNRGMFLGIGLAMVYVAWRLMLMRRPAAVAWIGIAAIVGLVLFNVLPVQERLNARLGFEGSSTSTRASLYQQSLDSVPASPVFGFGVPQSEGDSTTGPPVGTQGQVWMILVSHGPMALLACLAWLLIAIVQSRRRRDAVGLAAHTSLLVGTMELFYYGVLPYGLPLLMVAAAVALRPPDADLEQASSPNAAPQPVVGPPGLTSTGRGP